MSVEQELKGLIEKQMQATNVKIEGAMNSLRDLSREITRMRAERLPNDVAFQFRELNEKLNILIGEVKTLKISTKNLQDSLSQEEITVAMLKDVVERSGLTLKEIGTHIDTDNLQCISKTINGEIRDICRKIAIYRLCMTTISKQQLRSLEV